MGKFTPLLANLYDTETAGRTEWACWVSIQQKTESLNLGSVALHEITFVTFPQYLPHVPI